MGCIRCIARSQRIGRSLDIGLDPIPGRRSSALARNRPQRLDIEVAHPNYSMRDGWSPYRGSSWSKIAIGCDDHGAGVEGVVGGRGNGAAVVSTVLHLGHDYTVED